MDRDSGGNLSPPGDTRIWQPSDFVGDQLPTELDGVSVTVNGEPAYIYYISPTQLNVLTPPDLTTGPTSVVVTNTTPSAIFGVQSQFTSLSLFVFDGGPYVVATHLNGGVLPP